MGVGPSQLVLYVKEQRRLFLCLQMFIVKIRIIILGCTSMIYSRMERRGNRLVARETERESVCVLRSFEGKYSWRLL
jgi:hypothetical protein